MNTYKFPDTFIWGASTAAHQIEGNNVSSDWWARENQPNSGLSERSGDACDSYNRYPQDIDLLADSGLKMYRFSIEWARIEPEKGFFSKAQLLHYRAMIDKCLSRGVMPMVTLNHMTVPLWFAKEDGWLSPHAVEYFIRYVRYVSQILGDVSWICTINEPNMVALTRGGKEGEGMTAVRLPSPDPDIADTLVKAHHAAENELATLLPHAKTGWTIACQSYQAAPGCEKEMEDYQYPREDFFTEAAKDDNFVGVQAYLRTIIGKNGPLPIPDGVEKTLTGWEYYPQALENAVRHTWNVTSHTPIFVTENGLATSDDNRRIDYIYDALAGLKRAMDDGIDVRGYLCWSLIDNYEWGSFKPTFGLVGFNPETFERKPRPSLYWLGSIAKTQLVQHPSVKEHSTGVEASVSEEGTAVSSH